MSTGDDRATAAPGGDAALAAEYVLGLLAPEQVRVLEARIVVEPALAAEVAFWQERLAQLAQDEVQPVAPPPQLRGWTETELFGGLPPRPRRRWPAFAGGLLLGAGAVAVGIAGFLAVQSSLRLSLPPALQRLVPQAAPGYIARVDVPEAEMVALIRTTAGGRAGLLELSLLRQTAPPPGRALQLWLLPTGEPPMSLGLIPGSGRVSVPLGPALAERLAGAMIAISDEPPGGSPSGLPTGRVRAAVPLTAL